MELLTTNENNLLREPLLNDDERTTWRAVDLELQIPYAFITHSTEHDFVRIYSTTILWIQRDILQFCTAFRHNKKQEIHAIALLMPSEKKMEDFEKRWVQVEELWSCKTTPFSEAYPVYKTIENERIGYETAASVADQTAELLFASSKGGNQVAK